MNATEEWLRYIESQRIKQTYGVTGYTSKSDETGSEEVPEEES